MEEEYVILKPIIVINAISLSMLVSCAYVLKGLQLNWELSFVLLPVHCA